MLLALGEEAKAHPTLDQKQKELNELKEKLAKEQQKAEAVAKKERSLAVELGRIEGQLHQKTHELQHLEAKLQSSRKQAERLGREIAGAEAELANARTLLTRRLRGLYKQGRLSYARFLLSADDFSKFGRRVKYLLAIAHQDRHIITHYGQTLAILEGKREELERSKVELAQSRTLAQERRQEILEEQRKRRILLAKVREDKAGHLATIRELERASRELQALIAKLREESPSKDRGDGNAFAALKGRLPWPTSGAIVSSFGRMEHPRFRTVTFHKGIQISAPVGREIVAVHSGTVLYADWFKGYGRLLILDHGSGYYTVYAHASELLVKVGDRVSRGQVVAKVGDSGSLDGPLLYFELRYRGKPQDPLTWLEPRSSSARSKPEAKADGS